LSFDVQRSGLKPKFTPRWVTIYGAVPGHTRNRDYYALSEEIAGALKVVSVRITQDRGRIAVSVPWPAQLIGEVPAFEQLIRLMEQKQRYLPEFTALLGYSDDSRLVWELQNPQTPHVLICGTTGSGKSSLANVIITSLALYTRPSLLRFVIIDPLGRMAPFNWCSHVEVYATGMQDSLKVLLYLMDFHNLQKEVRTVLIIDEVQTLIRQLQHDGYGGRRMAVTAINALENIAASGRGEAINMVLITQHPLSDRMGRETRVNLPLRLVGQTASARAAAIATGIENSGAQHLLGAGDFLYVVGTSSLRFQVPRLIYDTTKNIDEITPLLKHYHLDTTWPVGMKALSEESRDEPVIRQMPALLPAPAQVEQTLNERIRDAARSGQYRSFRQVSMAVFGTWRGIYAAQIRAALQGTDIIFPPEGGSRRGRPRRKEQKE